MNRSSAKTSRLRIYVITLLAVLVVIGGVAAYIATNFYLQAQALRKPAQPTVQQVLPGFEHDAEEELRLAHIKYHSDRRGRVLVPPTTDDLAKIDPKLLEGIPSEAEYQPVPLAEAPVNYTETQFQQEREAWYRKYFVDEYQRAGHRDPKWDDAAIKFLEESGRRVAVTRFRRQRHSRFYPEQFDDALAADGQAILDLGCTDILLRSLLIEELHRQGKDEQAGTLAFRLQAEFGPSKYSEFVQYQVAKSLIGMYGSKELLLRYTKHYRRSLASQTFTDLERRILYEEGSSVIAKAHWDVLPEFGLSLEFQSNVDPWLRNMLLGDFYSTIAIESDQFADSWYHYREKLENETDTIRPMHLNHLRRAYRYYLQAYQVQPDLPETAERLFMMSFEQYFTPVPFYVLPAEDRLLPRLSEASPRFWFDKAVAAQFDHLPAYRQFRAGKLPDRQSEDWSQYAELIDFGRECMDSKRFDTAVPLGFYDAVHASIEHDEYVNAPPSLRNRRMYSNPALVEQFKELIAGYAGHLSDHELDYFGSLVVGMLWIQGNRDQALKEFVAARGNIRYSAFEELYLDIVDLRRKVEAREPPPPAIPNVAKMEVIAGVPDSNRILFYSGGNIGAWDLSQRRFVAKHSFPASPSGPPAQGSYSDGVRFATLSAPPKLQICDSKSLKPITEISFPEPVANHRLSRSGKLLAVLTGNQVQIWDVAEKKVSQSIPLVDMHITGAQAGGGLPVPIVRNFTFSEEDKWLAFVVGPLYQAPATNVDWYEGSAASQANRLVVWDLQEKKAVWNDRPFSPNITSLRFCEEGNQLMVAGTDWAKVVSDEYPFIDTLQLHSIKKFDPSNDTNMIQYIGHREPLWGPTEFGSDKSFLVATGKYEFLVWDAATGKEVTSVYPVAEEIRLFTAPRMTNRVVTVDINGDMNVYADEFHSGVRPNFVIPDFFTESRTRQILFDPDGRRIAVRSQDTGGHIWQYGEKGEAIGHCFRDSGPGQTTAHAFSRDLQWLATTPIERRLRPGMDASGLNDISIWNVAESTVKRTLRGCSSAVVCAQFSQDGRMLAAGLRDGNLMVWDLQSDSDEPTNTYREHQAAINCIKFSEDNRYLLTGGQSGVALDKPFPPSVRIWEVDADEGELAMLRKLEFTDPKSENSGVQWVDICADGSAVLASCGQQTALFSFEGERKLTVPGFLCAFKPDGTQFVTTGEQSGNNNFTLWQSDGKRLRDYRGGHREPINALSFTPDGASIISGSPSEGLAAWSTDTGERRLYIADLFQTK